MPDRAVIVEGADTTSYQSEVDVGKSSGRWRFSKADWPRP